MQRYNKNRIIRNDIYNSTFTNNVIERQNPILLYDTNSLSSIEEIEEENLYSTPYINNKINKGKKNTDEYIDVEETEIRSEARLLNPKNVLMNSIKNNNYKLKKVDMKRIKKDKEKSLKISGNNNTLGRRHSSVIDELKLKIPNMDPKNMILS